jgi:hypothetical protein
MGGSRATGDPTRTAIILNLTIYGLRGLSESGIIDLPLLVFPWMSPSTSHNYEEQNINNGFGHHYFLFPILLLGIFRQINASLVYRTKNKIHSDNDAPSFY